MPRFRKARRPQRKYYTDSDDVDSQNTETTTEVKQEHDLEHNNNEASQMTIKQEPLDQEEIANNDQFEEHSWLDMLAEVATETLKQEPPEDNEDDSLTQSGSSSKRLTRRAVVLMDVLHLDQIRELTDKVLVEMFGDLTCDEIKRTYTYTCMLIPSKCQEKYSSFGNENRARACMRDHLVNHVAELIDEANDPSVARKIKFTAEPVPARKKRLVAESQSRKEQIKKQKALEHELELQEKKNKIRYSKAKTDTSYTAIKPSAPPRSPMVMLHKLHSYTLPRQMSTASLENLKRRKKRKKQFTHKKSHKGSPLYQVKMVGDSEEGDDFTSKEALQALQPYKIPILKSETLNPMQEIIEENEIYIKDLITRTQPYMDHCYTSIFGKKADIERMECDPESDEDGEDPGISSRTAGLSKNQRDGPFKWLTLNIGTMIANTRTDDVKIPVMKLDGCDIPIDGSPLPVQLLRCSCSVASVEEISDTLQTTSNASKPYPPMPKTNWEMKGYIPVPEEEDTSSNDEEKKETIVRERQNKNDMKECFPDRVEALKHIRDLRKTCKEGHELVCKICRKHFTASATLMYHYRSHAGIKPYVCLVCNKTFTRQHSLNYHMLIHNNQSRFTCKECGRKFRHPSHFKEHLRRHTGETPFECTDCSQKFKTRNTYKRHLMTRHFKHLTAGGIFLINVDDLPASLKKKALCERKLQSKMEERKKLLAKAAGQERVTKNTAQTSAAKISIQPPLNKIKFIRSKSELTASKLVFSLGKSDNFVAYDITRTLRPIKPKPILTMPLKVEPFEVEERTELDKIYTEDDDKVNLKSLLPAPPTLILSNGSISP